ncbi:DUF998 domain-containing protein [Nonomuraea indica]|uniref:DUF998 domain-containing protein n=1 Tax=Nonomuraea indica TaxID=1581193 RepID=UPI001FE3B216|nr:DUF998 domain-containing protein [Nonomuraea indica]
MPVLLWADDATRPGHSLWHHSASQLGTGERAWLQTANFVLGGMLLLAFAAGLRRALRGGSVRRPSSWRGACGNEAGAGPATLTCRGH